MSGAVLTHPSGTVGPDVVLVHDVLAVTAVEDGDRVAVCDEGGVEILALVEPRTVLEWGGGASNF